MVTFLLRIARASLPPGIAVSSSAGIARAGRKLSSRGANADSGSPVRSGAVDVRARRINAEVPIHNIHPADSMYNGQINVCIARFQ